MTWQALLQQGLELAGLALLHATILAALTWVLCATLFRRARPAFQAVLWTVVLIKFLLPPVLPGETALSAWLAEAGLTVHRPAAKESLSASQDTLAVFAEASSRQSPRQAREKSLPMWLMLGAAAYLAGLCWVGGRSWVRSARLQRRVLALPPLEGPCRREVRELALRLGLRRPVEVRLDGEQISPYVTNAWSPTLILPESAVVMDAAARKALILHELAHIRRGDLVVRWLENAARILLFFWPPVWWVCRRIERASEMACDQWALSLSRVQPDVYARSLLEIVKNIAACPLERRQLAFAGKTSLLEERFEMILNKSPLSPRLTWLMIPVLLAWSVFALAGGSAPQSSEQPEKKQRVHKIRIAGGNEKLPAEVLEKFPEADLNGDGVLMLRELREHLGEESPQRAEHIVFRSPSGEGDVVFVGEAMGRLLERFPEADSNKDGTLQPEELRVYLHDHHDKGAYAFSHDDHGANVFIAGEGPIEDEEFNVVVASVEELAANYPEIDTDGDGALSKEEIQEWGRGRADQEGRFAVKIGPQGGDVDAFVWVFNEADGDVDWTSDEGRKIVVKVRTRADGEEKSEARTIILHSEQDELTEAEALARGEELSQGRRERLLKRYPEADLDGDGVLSKDEAQAWAAKLLKEREEKRPR